MGCSLSRNVQVVEDGEGPAATTEEPALSCCAASPIASTDKTESCLPSKITTSEECQEPCSCKESSIHISYRLSMPEIEYPIVESPVARVDEPVGIKTACCGMICHSAQTGICCEHDFTKPVEKYCCLCRERYEQWQEANRVFEDLLHEVEQPSDGSRVMKQKDSEFGIDDAEDDYPAGEQETSGSFVTYPSWDRFNSLQCRVLPCGHTVRRSPAEMLEPCPFCKRHQEQWGRRSGTVPMCCAIAALRDSKQQVREGFEIVCSDDRPCGLQWSPAKRRYTYITKRSIVSSLGESSTGSIRSFSDPESMSWYS